MSYPYTVRPVQQVGVDLRKVGVWVSPSNVVTSWLTLQTPIECIPHPHPYHMYAKCYCTLLICGWASEPIIIDLQMAWCRAVLENRGKARAE